MSIRTSRNYQLYDIMRAQRRRDVVFLPLCTGLTFPSPAGSPLSAQKGGTHPRRLVLVLRNTPEESDGSHTSGVFRPDSHLSERELHSFLTFPHSGNYNINPHFSPNPHHPWGYTGGNLTFLIFLLFPGFRRSWTELTTFTTFGRNRSQEPRDKTRLVVPN